MGEARLLERAFETCLALEVRERRILGRVGDADMYDSSDAGLSSGREELEGVLHREGVGEVAMIEADPVRVDEDIGAVERRRKSSRIIEMEGRCGDAIAERVGTPR